MSRNADTRRREEERVQFWAGARSRQDRPSEGRYITQNFTRHTHDGNAIGVIEQGAETFFYRNAGHVAPAGSVVVINPGEVHTGHARDESGWTYRMLYPDASLLVNAAAMISRAVLPDFPEPVIFDPPLADRIRKLHTVLETSSFRLERESALLETLTELIARHGERPNARRDAAPCPAWAGTCHSAPLPRQGASVPAVTRAREYIEANYQRNISLADLADIAGVSGYHLLRQFTRVMGLPPHAFHTQIRIRNGRELLRRGWPISQAALETGFTDQSLFSRRFKGIYGITPGQFINGTVA
jgi:AraC-like DNA-binding protein